MLWLHLLCAKHSVRSSFNQRHGRSCQLTLQRGQLRLQKEPLLQVHGRCGFGLCPDSSLNIAMYCLGQKVTSLCLLGHSWYLKFRGIQHTLLDSAVSAPSLHLCPWCPSWGSSAYRMQTGIQSPGSRFLPAQRAAWLWLAVRGQGTEKGFVGCLQ